MCTTLIIKNEEHSPSNCHCASIAVGTFRTFPEEEKLLLGSLLGDFVTEKIKENQSIWSGSNQYSSWGRMSFFFPWKKSKGKSKAHKTWHLFLLRGSRVGGGSQTPSWCIHSGCGWEPQARWPAPRCRCDSEAKEPQWVAHNLQHSFLSIPIAMEIVSGGNPNFLFINQLGAGFALGCLFPQHCSIWYYFLHDKLTTAGPVWNC